MNFNGKDYQPYSSAFNQDTYASRIVGRRGASPIPTGRSKVTSLESVMELILDGDVISYPHYYRTGDHGLKLVVEGLRAAGKKSIIVAAGRRFSASP